MNAAFALLIAIVIVCGLAIDHVAAVWSQPAVDVAAWAVFLALFARSAFAERIALLACLLLATAGELFLALVWQLYDYRLGNLPLFVPPGHVLLYALGLWLCKWMPVRAIPAACALIAVTALMLAALLGDELSLALTAMFLVCTRYGPAPQLYVTMFALAAGMELWGTWLGNWTWRSHVPWLDWSTLNPPFAAGAFYCVLDWLVSSVGRARAPRGAPMRAG